VRITQGMMNTQMMQNLQANNQRMMKYQDMLASGKRLNKPADDPIGVGYAMRYHAQIARNDQYLESVKDGLSQLEFLDTMMGQITSVMSRARELAVRGAEGSMSLEARRAIASEIHQLYEQLESAGNTQYNGNYIFNGQLTDRKPYKEGESELNSVDKGEINFMMAEGITITVNMTGDRVFGEPVDGTPGNTLDTSDNAFAILKSLEQALLADDQNAIGNSIQKLDVRLEKMQQAWTDIGARANRAQMLEKRLDDFSLNLNQLLSKTEDADIAETIMDLKMAENVQRASLSAGARIIQPTLIDFLR
jgi:flagellar hook-associated protein 3 FlgL